MIFLLVKTSSGKLYFGFFAFPDKGIRRAKFKHMPAVFFHMSFLEYIRIYSLAFSEFKKAKADWKKASESTLKLQRKAKKGRISTANDHVVTPSRPHTFEFFTLNR